MSGIKVQQSRFALLNIEDEDSEDKRQKSQQNKGNQQQKNGQKKKNKKKKQQTQAENDELKHLAFGVPTKHRTHSDSSTDNRQTNGANGKESQWQEWQKLDEEYAADRFEKDLQQALMLSKLDNEQKKTAKPGASSAGSHRGDGDGKDKQKKKKDKPQAMSLNQFNKALDTGKKTVGDELDSMPALSPTIKTEPTEGDHKFFDKVDDDVHRILRQEKMQEEYKKQYATESVVTAKYQEQIRKMEKEIEFLRATVKKQEEELKQVKKRNKQLCVILAQGEMKDKAEVLMQVDQLNEVRDELTEQVSELTADLEKERSKSHGLKTELDKHKGGKHK